MPSDCSPHIKNLKQHHNSSLREKADRQGCIRAMHAAQQSQSLQISLSLIFMPGRPFCSFCRRVALQLIIWFSILLGASILCFQAYLAFHLSVAPLTRASQYLPDACLFIGHDSLAPDILQFNTRALCLASSVCFPSSDPSKAYLHAVGRPSPRCSVHNPDLSPVFINSSAKYRELQSCADLQRRAVICAHGKGLVEHNASCPVFRPLDVDNGGVIRWFDNLSIVVPAYPFPGNIFHFASVATTLTFIIDSLPYLISHWTMHNESSDMYKSCQKCPPFSRRNINILLRQPAHVFQSVNWQRQLMQTIITTHLQPLGLNTRVYYLRSNTAFDNVCVRNAVVLGLRGNLNMWAFMNSSAMPLDGYSAPADAVWFKRIIYEAFHIPSRLPTEDHPISELPPLVVGYARRDAPRDPPPGKYVEKFLTRRFSDEDETWLLEMLKNETRSAGVDLHVFTTPEGEPLETQVKNIVQVGFLVGIHGANLVNSMFMHPFGALFEISPALVREECYMGGMNSGLAYWRHEVSELATSEESGCRPWDNLCRDKLTLRRVKLRAESDRRITREYVQKGIMHIVNLHQVYPEGVPVRLNPSTSLFDVTRRS